MEGKAIILVCYDFPPNEGIGGRRWAKLSKALVREGYKVHVIKADPLPGQEHSPWQEDIAVEGISTYSIGRTYPEVVKRGPKSFADKLHYRLAIRWLKLIEKGTIHDRSIGWRRPFQSQLERLLKVTKAQNVIATGAPFNLLYYTAETLQAHPLVRYIVDYRDPWLTSVNYGMVGLKERRFREEKRKQDKVFMVAAYVLTPSTTLTDELATEAMPGHKSQFVTLKHFYDPEDFPDLTPKKDSGSLKVIYGGSLYVDIQKHLQLIADALSEIRTTHPDLYQKFELHFYTSHHQLASVFADHSKHVFFHQPIGKAYYKKLNEADAALVLLAEHNKDFLTTKFYELTTFKKPLLYFGEQGKASDEIGKNNLGRIHQTTGDVVSSLLALDNRTLEIKMDYNTAPFSLNERVHELINLLQ